MARDPSLLLSKGFRQTITHHGDRRQSGTITARRPDTACESRFPGSPNSTGILAQEKFRGESLLFVREEARFRQRAQPLAEGDAPAQRPEPAEGPHPGRRDYAA